MDYTYSAFISYRHLPLDAEVARQIEAEIEHYTVPKALRGKAGGKKLRRVFRDQDELPLSSDLGGSIDEALAQSEWLIVICTPQLMESKWCMREIERFIELGRINRIIPVLADGTQQAAMPPQILSEVKNGVVVPREPIAVEARAKSAAARKKLLKTEKFRILAAMLDVGFDELRQRARQRRMKIQLIASLAVTVLVAAITVYTLIQARRVAEQRDIAEQQRDIAEEQRTIAEEQRDIADAQRREAILSNIDMLLEKSSAATSAGDRLVAAQYALEADALSALVDGERRGEIASTMQAAVYNSALRPLVKVKNNNMRLADIIASPDGRYLLGKANSNSLALIDGITGEILYTVSDSTTMINDLAFSPDGSRFLAICNNARTFSVWETEDGELLFRYVSKEDREFQISSAVFWNDSDTFLVLDRDTLYRVSTGGAEAIYTLGTHDLGFDRSDSLYAGRVTLYSDDYIGTPVVLSPDGEHILVGGLDATDGVCIINSDGTLATVLEHMPGIMMDDYCFSPDGSLVSVKSYGEFWATWDARTGELLYSYGLDPAYVSSNTVFSADSKSLAIVMEDESGDEYLYVIDARTAKYLWGGRLTAHDGLSIVPTVKFTEDGNYLIATNGNLTVIDTNTRSVVLSIASDDPARGVFNTVNNSVPFADNSALLVSTYDGTATIYSLPATASVHDEAEFSGELVPVPDYTVPAENRGLSLQGKHELTDAFKASNIRADAPPVLFFAQDSDFAALAYADGVVEIFDTARSDEPVYVLSEHENNGVYSVAFCGGLMVCSGVDNRVSAFDLNELRVLRVYQVQRSPGEIAFSPDGRRFMVKSQDSLALSVFDPDFEQCLFEMENGRKYRNFGFAADGSAAVGIQKDGATVGELFPDYDDLIARARKLVKEAS